jgi:hypothetical protein
MGKKWKGKTRKGKVNVLMIQKPNSGAHIGAPEVSHLPSWANYSMAPGLSHPPPFLEVYRGIKGKASNGKKINQQVRVSLDVLAAHLTV